MVNVKPRPLNPWERDLVPTVQDAGWVLESVRTDTENLARTSVQTPDRPARRKSIYRLRYLGRRSKY